MDHPKIQQDDKGSLFLNFGSYGEEVEVAAISGDGRRLLTVRDVGVAEVWEVDTGKQVARIEPDSPLRGTDDAAPASEPFHVFIESADLSPDGALALLGLNDGTAQIYRVHDPTSLAVLHPPDEEPATRWGVIRSVRYSDDGRLALVGFPGRRVGAWSPDGSRLVGFFGAPLGNRLVGRPAVRNTLTCAVAESFDGSVIFAGAADRTVALFDAKSGDTLMEATEHAETILALFDTSDGIGWATTAGAVWIATSDGRPTKRLDTGEHWREVVFDRDRVLARCFDGSISRWSFDGQWKLLFSQAAPVRGGWADNATTLALGDAHCHYPETGYRIVVESGTCTCIVQRDAQVVRVKLSPDHHLVGTDGWKDEVELWETATGKLHRSLPCPGGTCSFAFSPDGALVAIGEVGHGGGRYDRHVYVYDAETGEERWKLAEHDFQVRQVAFSPDGRLLASLADDLVVWDLTQEGWSENEPTLRSPLNRSAGAFHFAGNRLIAVEKGRVHIFRGTEKVLSFEAPIQFQTPWTVSDDGGHISIGGVQAVIRFDLSTGKLDRCIEADIPRPERLPPISLANQHDIRGGASLWRTDEGRFLHQGDGPRGWLEPLRLSVGGLVAVRSETGAAIVRVTDEGGEMLGTVPFQGKLRASRFVHGEVLLVNHEGQLFQAPVPTI